MDPPLIVICFVQFEIAILLITSIKILKVSKIDSFHIVEAFLSHLVDCKPLLHIFDKIINIYFFQWFDIFFDLGIILLLSNPSSCYSSCYPICYRLAQINIPIIFYRL